MIKSLLCAAALLTVPVSSARSQNITPDGMARSVSLAFFVGEICSNYYKIDKDLAFNFAQAMAEVGNKQVGVKNFGKISSVELKRRGKEIDATGARMWCSYQRPNLNQLGLKVFLD